MFSGIVEESAACVSLNTSSDPARLIIRSGLDHTTTALGDSICIEGVCLTVVRKDVRTASESYLEFDLAAETLRRSTLGELSAGGRVNLERSLQLGARLHGHLVFGHVDTTAQLISRKKDGQCDRLVFQIPSEYLGYLATKGSISISGVSLTLGEITASTFAVYIIPHTSEVTTLTRKKEGDIVNIEVDMLARYVHSALAHRSSAPVPLSETMLARAGFA